MGYLENINSPKDIKGLDFKQLNELSDEMRLRIIDVVSSTGGHLAASLGAVEIAVALHHVLDTPKDKILWDVGHQAYAHKLLTGRNKNFDTLRQVGGISGFPNHNESEYDPFIVGHSSTSISQALGLACANDILETDDKIVAVIGDASISNGMALEALNNVGHLQKDVTIILNDNKQSISKTVGSISRYLNKIITNPVYNKARNEMQSMIKKIPKVGDKAYTAARKIEERVKSFMVPGAWFEELDIRYFGGVNGHNVEQLIETFKNVIPLKGPKIIHVITQKGKGYELAEKDPEYFHGLSAFEVDTGKPVNIKDIETFSSVFGKKMVDIADKRKDVVAITAAMTDGTGLKEFSEKYPDRFFDVGIAEEHAVTFAGAMAKKGLRPVICMYSTFLQRAYDQIIHDVSLQKFPVIFCLDRAGLVGEDGPTHHGVFDIAFLRHIPDMTLMAPSDGFELEKMIEHALTVDGPVAIRYPRGSAQGRLPISSFEDIQQGRASIVREGKDLAIIALGTMVQTAISMADILSSKSKEATVVNARFAKPLDAQMLEDIFSKHKKVVTLEEGVVEGGFGSAILEFVEQENIKDVRIKRIALPDHFIEHGNTTSLLAKYHMNAEAISETILAELF